MSSYLGLLLGALTWGFKTAIVTKLERPTWKVPRSLDEERKQRGANFCWGEDVVFRLGFLRRLKVLLKRCLKTFRPKLLVKSFAFRPLAKRNCSSGHCPSMAVSARKSTQRVGWTIWNKSLLLLFRRTRGTWGRSLKKRFNKTFA